MEVLFEYKGSRRHLNVAGGESITRVVSSELQRVGKSRAQVFTARDDLPSSRRGEHVPDIYLLQKWSAQWDCYIDVTHSNEIADGDRLAVVAKPKPTSKFLMLCCCGGDSSYRIGKVGGSGKNRVPKTEEIQSLEYRFRVDSAAGSILGDSQSIAPSEPGTDDLGNGEEYIRAKSGRASWKLVRKHKETEENKKEEDSKGDEGDTTEEGGVATGGGGESMASEEGDVQKEGEEGVAVEEEKEGDIEVEGGGVASEEGEGVASEEGEDMALSSELEEGVLDDKKIGGVVSEVKRKEGALNDRDEDVIDPNDLTDPNDLNNSNDSPTLFNQDLTEDIPHHQDSVSDNENSNQQNEIETHNDNNDDVGDDGSNNNASTGLSDGGGISNHGDDDVAMEMTSIEGKEEDDTNIQTLAHKDNDKDDTEQKDTEF